MTHRVRHAITCDGLAAMTRDPAPAPRLTDLRGDVGPKYRRRFGVHQDVIIVGSEPLAVIIVLGPPSRRLRLFGLRKGRPKKALFAPRLVLDLGPVPNQVTSAVGSRDPHIEPTPGERTPGHGRQAVRGIKRILLFLEDDNVGVVTRRQPPLAIPQKEMVGWAIAKHFYRHPRADAVFFATGPKRRQQGFQTRAARGIPKNIWVPFSVQAPTDMIR